MSEKIERGEFSSINHHHTVEFYARNTRKDPASTRMPTISSLQLQKGWIYDKNKNIKRKTPETDDGLA